MTVRLPLDTDRFLLAIGVLVIFFGPVSADEVGDDTVPIVLPQLLVWALALAALFALVRESAWAKALLSPSAAAVLLVGMFELAQGRLPFGLSHLVGGSLALAGSALMLRRPSPSRLPLPDRFVSAAPPLPDDPQAARVPDSEIDPLLEAFMDEAARLNREEARRLATLWRSGDAPGRRSAWRAVRRLASGRGRQGDIRRHRLDDTRSRVAELGLTAEGSVWTWVVGTMEDVDRGDLRRATVPALLDAGAALIWRDRLDAEDFDALYGPWRRLRDSEGPSCRMRRTRLRPSGASGPQVC